MERNIPIWLSPWIRRSLLFSAFLGPTSRIPANRCDFGHVTDVPGPERIPTNRILARFMKGPLENHHGDEFGWQPCSGLIDHFLWVNMSQTRNK